jgi:membrane fusion protein, multidrug efflux system
MVLFARFKSVRSYKAEPMDELRLHTPSRSKRVSLIAGVLLVAIVGTLLIFKKFPLGGSSPAPDAKPSAQAQVDKAQEKSAAGGEQAGGAKPAQAGAPGGAKAPPPTPVRVAEVKQTVMTDDVSAVGNLLAEESVIVRPEIAGRISKIHFSEGQVVKDGAPLISIDPAELKGQLAQTVADVTLTDQRYKRSQNLFKQNFISRQALEEARSNFERAVAGREETLAKMSKTQVRAPFGGILGMRNISAGAYVKPGDDIVRLENISSVKLDFRIPEAFLDKVRNDQEVAVKVDAYPSESFTGKIYAIEPIIDEKTRTVLLRARVSNDNRKLRAGMFARVNLILEKRGTALMIPEQAIVPKGNAFLVVKVVDGKAEFTPIKIGKRRPGEVEVLEGLAEHDVVVTDGQMKLAPGGQVMVLDGSAPKAPERADGNGGNKG